MNPYSILTVVLMVAAGLVSFVPFIPGPALVWAIGVVYAVATEFREVGVWAVVIMTVLMIVGSTADYWTRFLGLNAEGSLSCGTIVVSTIGAILGTWLLPIPVVGTLVGAAGAVMVLVWYQEDDIDKAWVAARGIMKAWIASFFVEFLISLTIVFVFLRAIFDTWGIFQ